MGGGGEGAGVIKGTNLLSTESIFIPLRVATLGETVCLTLKQIQLTLVISKSKGPSKTRRDIRTSTYQISSIKEKKQFE